MAGNHSSQLSPRQRMINMMYLVLTALLALNVSKSVLDAFFRVDKTLTQTVSDKTGDNMDRYIDFQMRAENNPEKIGKWNDMAQELKIKTLEVDDLIDSIRYELWKAGGPTIDGEAVEITEKMEQEKSLILAIQGKGGYELIDKANKNSPKIIMLDEHNGNPGAGLRLKNVLTSYREYLLSLDLYPLTDTTIKNVVYDLLKTEDVEGTATTLSWEENEYGGYPLVGVLTFLNQTKLNVRTAEDMMLELLEQKTGKSLVSIDKQIPYAIPQSSFVMEGDSLKARLFLAGIDTQQRPVYDIYEIDENLKNPETGEPLPKGTTYEAIYNIANRRDDNGNIIGTDTLGFKYIYTPDITSRLDENIMTDADGMGVYSKKMAQKGTKYIGGFATVQSSEGDLIYPWVMEIRVESPTPVIAATNLNVIYFGLDNDFTIAAPGYDPKDLDLRSNYGPLKINPKKGGASGEYILSISDNEIGKKSKVKLSVIDKKTRKVIGKDITFRLMKRPMAVTSINGKYSGDDVRMDVVLFKTLSGLSAETPESFVYDLQYRVVEYSISYVNDRGKLQEIEKIQGRKFSEDPRVVSAIQAMKSGKTITFYNIKTQVIQNGKTKPGDNQGSSITVKLNK